MSPLLLEMPGGPVSFRHLVLDFTGTLSKDGVLQKGVVERVKPLASALHITVLTADTFGTVEEAMRGIPVEVTIIRDGKEKAEAVSAMGPEGVIAIGNGRDDIPMMEVAGLAIAVVGPEGAAAGLLSCSDLVTRNIHDALDLISNPLRLKATLRD